MPPKSPQEAFFDKSNDEEFYYFNLILLLFKSLCFALISEQLSILDYSWLSPDRSNIDLLFFLVLDSMRNDDCFLI